MKTIHIQGLEKPVSVLIQGSDYFRPSNYETVCEVLDRFFSIGGNTIDTAHVYCGGESEVAIGQWMRERGNREDVIILTKGAHHDQNGPRVNPEAISKDLFESLERLGTDYVDLYALHRDDPNVPVSEIMDVLNEHIVAGRIKAIGGSNWTVERIQEANEYAASKGLIGFTFSSPNLSLAKPNEPFWAGCVSVAADDCKWHKEQQIPILSWSSQARGFFTGRFSPEDRSNKDLVRVFYNEANWERLRRAEVLAEEKGVTAIQIALAYVLNQPFPTGALIGAQNEHELMSCLEGSEIRLTEDELRWLEDVDLLVEKR
ncbi:aldo/keto reductase [Alkalihalobacillus alcalophilus ATCC 27647 = CGMCC 1.3604]|uniref:Aldo/keto reductase n=1 Tax=Alkalihalobacillus alcalophilus ATCC 27647 = CGMCC 1.3604 TaxID=1218173 RepID=A0A094XC51_ALKAL|nr:aldo/keto reductase [Alkalihalobacillus alcalophilus]KGA96370.1 aldo/keto reductase [Alkalihalobacillus alcalophilus ATCC 27647 = CGMCC 1.3604]MED1563491.1 aldo/keto reductase [Alkalihalobacillus alcalophilus]THG90613.1 aldo/keto reductase [Alkalihalobacillus alcalophilus ATCC 27647 = CGMCC 1.3604]